MQPTQGLNRPGDGTFETVGIEKQVAQIDKVAKFPRNWPPQVLEITQIKNLKGGEVPKKRGQRSGHHGIHGGIEVGKKAGPGQVENPSRMGVAHDPLPIYATFIGRNPRVEQSERIRSYSSLEI